MRVLGERLIVTEKVTYYMSEKEDEDRGQSRPRQGLCWEEMKAELGGECISDRC